MPADAFNASDSNDDSALTAAEAGNSTNAVVRLFAESAFRSGADVDGLGDISEAEFLAASPAGAFLSADASGDALLSPSEVLASSAPLLLALADTDRSNDLSVAEVAACYSAYDVANAEVLRASTVAAATALDTSSFSATNCSRACSAQSAA